MPNEKRASRRCRREPTLRKLSRWPNSRRDYARPKRQVIGWETVTSKHTRGGRGYRLHPPTDRRNPFGGEVARASEWASERASERHNKRKPEVASDRFQPRSVVDLEKAAAASSRRCHGTRHETRPDCVATTCELPTGAGVATPTYYPSTDPLSLRAVASP